MYADTLDELHAMAAKIGMKREWFQDKKSLPHYDLTVSRRAAAVRAGAIERGSRQLMDFMKANNPTDRMLREGWVAIDDSFDCRTFFGKTVEVRSEMSFAPDGKLTLTNPTHYRLRANA
jgi:hypothetical protein